MKRCRRCLVEKDSSEFSASGPRTCKPCQRDRLKAYRRAWRRSAIGRATARRNDGKQRRKASRIASMKRYRAVWMASHRDQMANSRSRYKASPKGRETEAAYQARLRGAERVSPVDPVLWAQVVEEYSGACAYCRVAPGTTRDHIIPLSAGGPHRIENLVPACRECNSRKHTKRIAPKIPLSLRARMPTLYAGLVRTIYGSAA